MVATVLAFIIFLIGVTFIYIHFQNCYRELSLQENLVLSFGCSTILLVVCSMILALVGAFRLRYAAAAYLLVCAIVFCFSWRNRKQKIVWKELLRIKLETPLIIIVILAAILYFSFPTYYMWAGRDYGIYFINGIYTAKTGEAEYPMDQWLNENYEYLDEVIEPGYPGFYSAYMEGTSQRPGDINEQFLPLYWCLLSIAYNLAGIEGMVRITALLTILSLCIYYFFLKHFSGRRVAIAGTFLLTICPAQIWGARITQSEQMAQLLFVLASFLFALGWEKDKKSLLYLGTAMVGIGSFCRIDNYFLGLGMISLGIYTALFCSKKRKTVFVCVIQCMLWFALGLIYTQTAHPEYIYHHWKSSLGRLLGGNLALFIIYLIVMFIVMHKEIRESDLIYRICSEKRIINMISFLAGVFIVVLYVIRPIWSDSVFSDGLRQYGFYFCPLLLPFFVAGIGAVLKVSHKESMERKVEPLLLFLGTGAVTAMLYSFRPSITMDHFFMSRRWIPVNFPFIFFVAAAGFFYLFDRGKKKTKLFYLKQGLLLGCAAFVILYIADKDRILMKEPAYKEMKEDYEELNRNLPHDTLILTDRAAIAGMLRYAYDQKVYLLCDEINSQQIIDYIEAKGDVYYLGNIWNSPIFWKVEGELCYSGTIQGRAPESCVGYYPKEIQNFSEMSNLYRLLPKECDSLDLISAVNVFDESLRGEDSLMMTGQGCAFFGPYINLPESEYELYIQVESELEEDEVIGKMEIVMNEEVLYAVDVTASDQPFCIPFEIRCEEDVLQTRFIKTCEEDVKCTMLRLCK